MTNQLLIATTPTPKRPARVRLWLLIRDLGTWSGLLVCFALFWLSMGALAAFIVRLLSTGYHFAQWLLTF